MIISASYKTDISAFYGEWCRNRLRAGCCRMVNPGLQPAALPVTGATHQRSPSAKEAA